MSTAMSRKKSWLPPASLAESLNSFPAFIPSDVHVKREITAYGGSSTSVASPVPSVCGKLVSKAKISSVRSHVPTPNRATEARAQPSLPSLGAQSHLLERNREVFSHCPADSDSYSSYSSSDRPSSWSYETELGAGFNVERSSTAHSSTPPVFASFRPVDVQLSFYAPVQAKTCENSCNSVAPASEGVSSQVRSSFRKSKLQHVSLPSLEDQPHIARQQKGSVFEKKRKTRVPLKTWALASLRSTKSRGGLIEQLLCGGFAGIVSRTAVAPIDLIKTHLISSHYIPGAKTTAVGVLRDIIQRDGWKGLFRGNGVNCLRVGPHKAIEFCTFETLKRLLLASSDPLHLQLAAPLSGGAAGMAGTLATYPLELIRTRITIQPAVYRDLPSSFAKIVREEGFTSLYRGILPSLLGVFPYAASNYFVYDRLRAAYRRTTGQDKVPVVPTLLFGAVSAAVASTITFPLEVARRRLQLGSVAAVSAVSSGSAAAAAAVTAAAPRTSLDVLRGIWQAEGPAAIYRGLGATWLKLLPAAGISFVCYEAARVALRVDDASWAADAAAVADATAATAAAEEIRGEEEEELV